MTTKVGVIGLGNMGGGMAATLARNGFDVSGFDLSEAALEQVAAKGVKPVKDRAELIRSVDVLVLSLPKAEHVEAVCLGANGILELGHAGQIIIDTTTSTPVASRKVAAALAEKSIGFLDAPVSGGPAGAAAGSMTMVIGAEPGVLERAMPVLEAMSGNRVHVGGYGTGNVVKIANNLLAAAHLITTAEAVSLAAKAGVAPEKLIEGLNAGSGRSAASQVMFPTWVLNKAYNSGFTMGLMRKDVGLASALAGELDLDLPVASLVSQLWQSSRETLADGEDFNCIVMRTDAKLFGHEE
ncbi:NAD(P)-dependent oxidoreductase [Pseudomonas benzenivorans]|uniref:NAD(P)-dependent oxidoreductase n=1 Tax=Pseudomonas benzenivorans TaxID=556533 RepID=A0ABY5H9D9_9PSED|nr:NAD(P)-dependent oxidoreductase [Pseudomonas benzenivorans]UTW08014.1 NAD(P)-dependent oxidoreductase [Pseudomonas benzenivorans]